MHVGYEFDSEEIKCIPELAELLDGVLIMDVRVAYLWSGSNSEREMNAWYAQRKGVVHDAILRGYFMKFTRKSQVPVGYVVIQGKPAYVVIKNSTFTPNVNFKRLCMGNAYGPMIPITTQRKLQCTAYSSEDRGSRGFGVDGH